MWLRIECLMQGTALSVVDRETWFNNEFDQFTIEPGESLVSVYNRFTQLMNDLKRNEIELPTVTINTKLLNYLQPEWIKYVTSFRLAKDLTARPYDVLFITFSNIRNLSFPQQRKNYDDEYQGEMFQNDPEDPLTSAMMLLLVQSLNVILLQQTTDFAHLQTQEIKQLGKLTEPIFEAEMLEMMDSKYFIEQMLLAKKDEAGVILSNKQNDFLLADAAQMEELEELSVTYTFDSSISLDHPCCGVLPSCLSAVILSLIMSLKCEYRVVN
nr:hypothetical protein [Tanacetum cinerariifolium]